MPQQVISTLKTDFTESVKSVLRVWYNRIKWTRKEVVKIAGTYRPTGVTDELLETIREIHRELFDEELPPDVIITTDKMTPEEERFETIAQLMRNGSTYEEACRQYEELKEVEREFEEEEKMEKAN